LGKSSRTINERETVNLRVLKKESEADAPSFSQDDHRNNRNVKIRKWLGRLLYKSRSAGLGIASAVAANR
jgi:hypothetical protein